MRSLELPVRGVSRLRPTAPNYRNRRSFRHTGWFVLNSFRNSFRLLLLAATLVTAALLASCASGQGIPPAGGPADTTAPAITATDPVDGTVNFSGDRVLVEFDEYVNEEGVARSVIITPIPVRQPEFNWGGGFFSSRPVLEIEFREPLLPNRTYAVTFGGDIADVTGNRMGRPLTLRFATGPKMDSGTIRGSVIGVGERRAFVIAYLMTGDPARFSDTLRPDLTRPDFIAPTDDAGAFSLEGLPPGRYRLFTVTDEFGDQLYTPGTDAIGVAVEDITVDSAYRPVGGVALRLAPAPADIAPPTLYSATSINGSRTELRFSEPIDTATIGPGNFTIEAAGTAVTIQEAWRSTTNRLAVTLSHSPLPAGAEAVARAVRLRDTIGLILPDTSGIARFTVTDQIDTLPPLLLAMRGDSILPYRFPDSIRIAFDEGVQTANEATAVALRDSTGRTARFRLRRVSPAEFVAYPLDTLFNVEHGFIDVALGSFSDRSGNRRDSTVRTPVDVAPPRQYGTLQGTVTDTAAPTAPHVIEAISIETGRIYRRTIRTGSWEFQSLPEGEYSVRAFRDTDGDGAYDFGTLTPYLPAEPFTEWAGEIRIRPRWTVKDVNLLFGHR